MSSKSSFLKSQEKLSCAKNPLYTTMILFPPSPTFEKLFKISKMELQNDDLGEDKNYGTQNRPEIFRDIRETRLVRELRVSNRSKEI